LFSFGNPALTKNSQYALNKKKSARPASRTAAIQRTNHMDIRFAAHNTHLANPDAFGELDPHLRQLIIPRP